MAKKWKKPEIRFAGYETEWIEKKFDETFDMLSNNTLSRDALNYDGGMAKNIHYGDVLVKFGEYIDVNREQLPYINDATVGLKFLKSYLKDGDIIIADTAEDESVGKCTEVIGIGDTPVISGLHTIPCRPKQKYAPKYMGYYLNSNAYHDGLLPLMQGVKVTSISRTGIRDTDLILSDEIEEQAKIGKFLSSLDEMLASEVSKYKKLTIVKKTFIEKMFPKNGSNTPEIRFNGFADPWEQRRLCEIADKVTEKNVSSAVSETFTNSAEYGVISQRDFFDRDISKFENIGNYYVVGEDDFVYNPRISRSAPVGPINRNKLGRKGVMSPLYTVFKTHDIDSTFLEYFFKGDGWHSYMFFNGDTGARFDRFSIKNEVFFDMPIPYPQIEEQRKIGNYLDSLDNLITLHQRRLEKLKNMKVSCMAKMFV